MDEIDDISLARALLGNIRSAISEVSNPDYHRKLWRGDLDGERSSFVEIYYLISDCDIDIVRAHRELLHVSNTEWELTLRFLVKFLRYYSKTNDVYDHDEIFKDPEWAIVVESAKDADALT